MFSLGRFPEQTSKGRKKSKFDFFLPKFVFSFNRFQTTCIDIFQIPHLLIANNLIFVYRGDTRNDSLNECVTLFGAILVQDKLTVSN